MDLSNIRSAVDEAKTVVASAIALIAGISAQIRANAGDQAAINALADSLDTQTHDLAAAVTANTAAEGSTTASDNVTGTNKALEGATGAQSATSSTLPPQQVDGTVGGSTLPPQQVDGNGTTDTTSTMPPAPADGGNTPPATEPPVQADVSTTPPESGTPAA